LGRKPRGLQSKHGLPAEIPLDGILYPRTYVHVLDDIRLTEDGLVVVSAVVYLQAARGAFGAV